MAKADDTSNTERILLCQGWAITAAAYGELTREVLKKALAEGRMRTWDGSGRPIEPDFWRLECLEIAWGTNSAIGPPSYSVLHPDGRVTSGPERRQAGNITVAIEDVTALLPASQVPQRPRRRPRLDQYEPVVRDIWPSGKPPRTMSTGEALRRLGEELQRRSIPCGPDTLDSQRRALNRR
jgi:hypothetical protein